MANKRKDLTGQRFGMLQALYPTKPDEKGRWYWMFECDCGRTVERSSATMVKAKKQDQKSHCGCNPPLKTHGLSKNNQRLYWVWKSMNQRCTNPTCKDFPHYGGRGIKVCKEWLKFENFYNWAILTGYKEAVTIERINVNSDYESSNCTWVNNSKQPRNRTDTVRFEYMGEMRDLREISEICGIAYLTLKARLTQYGWSVARATTEKPFKGKNQTHRDNVVC